MATQMCAGASAFPPSALVDPKWVKGKGESPYSHFPNLLHIFHYGKSPT